MTTQEELFTSSKPVVGEVEKLLDNRDVATVIGVDEAGRGPLAGPVYAGAFWLELSAESLDELAALDDSKKLDLATREKLYEELVRGERPYAIASVGAQIIDEINILQATFRAMTKAVEDVIATAGAEPDVVLVDGNLAIPQGTWKQRPIVGGDQRSIAIAAASVLAKVARDRFMCEADHDWPDYGFSSHKGYGTPQHRQALRDHGPCTLHRRSFAGVVQDSP